MFIFAAQLQKKCLSGGTGRRARLKIVYRKVCRFDSGLRCILVANEDELDYFLVVRFFYASKPVLVVASPL